jgi:hypothetical protein
MSDHYLSLMKNTSHRTPRNSSLSPSSSNLNFNTNTNTNNNNIFGKLHTVAEEQLRNSGKNSLEFKLLREEDELEEMEQDENYNDNNNQVIVFPLNLELLTTYVNLE